MRFLSGTALAVVTIAATAGASAQAQDTPIDAHLRTAQIAAGLDYQGLLGLTCIALPALPRTGPPPPRINPARDAWYAPPEKVFDNLYFLGTKVNSAWALVDPKTKGIILIDNLYNYAGKAEIIDGMKTLDLDPANIKYNLVSHGHGDHDEYIKALQDQYHIRVGLGGPDWDLMDQSDQPGGHPAHDISVTDGQKFTVGDTTVTAVSTPGHTAGTTSWIFPVLDHGKTVMVAYSGGTAISGFGSDAAKYDQYIASYVHMADAAKAAGATVILTNHSQFDDAMEKSQLSQMRKPGQPSPFDMGVDGVQRYFVVAEECAMANKLKNVRSTGS